MQENQIKLTDRLDIIIQTASKLTNTPIGIITGKKRTKAITSIRLAITRVARAEGFSWREIGSRLNRHRTTLMDADKNNLNNSAIDNLVARITEGIADVHFLDKEIESLVWNLAQEWVSKWGELGSVHLTLDPNGWLASMEIATQKGNIRFMARAIHPKPWVALLRAYNQAIKDISEGNIKVDLGDD